ALQPLPLRPRSSAQSLRPRLPSRQRGNAPALRRHKEAASASSRQKVPSPATRLHSAQARQTAPPLLHQGQASRPFVHARSIAARSPARSPAPRKVKQPHHPTPPQRRSLQCRRKAPLLPPPAVWLLRSAPTAAAATGRIQAGQT